ncbi:unnamed protein product [Symbiodinium microadriaticum]|nr:unnamed protein product [Symbiodinium microadriaticum]
MGAQVAQEGAGWRTGAQKAQMAQVAQGGAWRRRKAQMVVQGGAHGAGWRKVTQTAQGWRMAAQGGAGGCMQEGMQVHWRRAAPVAQAVTAQSRPRMTPALKGLTTVPDFAYAFGKASELDCFCSDDYAQLWQDLQVEDPVHSPAMARLRRAHVRAPAVSLAEDTAPQPSTASPPAQPQINSWAEHAPPRLDASVIAQLTKDFKANYPGEFLDSDAMPSVRLLSIVHKWFAPQGTITPAQPSASGTAPEPEPSTSSAPQPCAPSEDSDSETGSDLSSTDPGPAARCTGHARQTQTLPSARQPGLPPSESLPRGGLFCASNLASRQ